MFQTIDKNLNQNSTIVNTALVIMITLVTFNLTGCGYNKLQKQDVSIESTWSEVINQYQRRAELIPQLVTVTKKYAEQEKEIFAEVAKARSQIGNIQLTPDMLNDKQAMEQFQQAQAEMGGALSHLLAISESYPNLKSDAVFLKLQDEIAGTENRIAVARGRYIKQVGEYNMTVRQFPTNITAKAFGMDTKPNFSVDNQSNLSTPPKIDLGE